MHTHTVKLPAIFNIVGTGSAVFLGLLLSIRACFPQTQGGTVVAWGDNTYGQTNVPPGLTNVVSIATCYEHNLALNANGTVAAWGDDTYGQCDVPPSLTNVVAIQAGDQFSAALLSDSTVQQWGEAANMPVGLSNVVAIAAGSYHCLALKSDGTVVGWGDDIYGQVDVPAGLSNVVAIAGGVYHSLALIGDGSVVCWGLYCTGVIPGISNALAISGAFNISFALDSDGTAMSFNSLYNTLSSSFPGQSNLVSIAVEGVGLAINNSGSIVSSGTNIPPGLTNVLAVSAGSAHVLSLIGNSSLAVVRQPLSAAISAGSIETLGVGVISPSPLTFQWQFNGANIPNATNSWLRLIDVQATNSGAYNVLISNINSTTVSSDAALTVIPSAPMITVQPSNCVVPFGGEAVLTSSAQGTEPLYFQWLLNNLPVPYATNSALLLAGIASNNVGNYNVVVTNSSGAATSSVATLNIAGPIVAWGEGTSGQTNVPAGLTNVAAIAAGAFYGLALNNDGTLTGWGSMTTISAGVSNMIAIAGGSFHCLALQNDGTVQGWGDDSPWGDNSYGEVTIPVGLSNVVGIAAGAFHSLALRNDGTVVAWGGRSGFGPGPPPAGLNNVVAIAAGYYFALALKNDGTVVGWGITVPAGLSNIVAIAGSGSGGLALTGDGNVIGLGVTVPSSLANVTAIAGGGDQYLALNNDGTITAWGADGYGECDVPSGITEAVAIAGGEYYSLALLSYVSPSIVRQPLNVSIFSGLNTHFNAGVVGSQPISYQWQFNGSNVSGATNTTLILSNVQPVNEGNYSLIASNSDGTATTSTAILNVITSPPIIASEPTNLIAPIGQNAVFNILTTGSMPVSYQWLFDGNTLAGATNASLSLSNIPWAAEGTYSVVVSNQYGSVRSSTVMLLIPRARVVAWGNNTDGQTNVPLTLTNAIGIAAGNEKSLALKADGTLVVWGVQTAPPPGLSNVLVISTGGGNAYSYSLALKSDSTVTGWGNNSFKQTSPPPGLSNVVAIAAGQTHSLALLSFGNVVAWGNNTSGQTNVPATLTNAIAIAAGGNASLALRSDGSLVAWGDNTYGQTNIPSGLTNVTTIASGWFHFLALRNDGTISAWGNNSFQQVNVPIGLSNIIAIAAGADHSLAVKSDGTVVAWGQNTYKQTNVPVALNHVVSVAGGADHSLALIEDGPPLIFTQPSSQTNYAGFTALLVGNCGGLRPLYLQWMLDGTNVNGATNSILTLTNLQPSVAGTYSFVCSNSLGTAISSSAVICVLTNAPVFTQQPTNQTLIAGSNATFSAAVGAGPIPNIFQWQFNGTNIIGATNAALTLTDVQSTNQGNYVVLVNNGYGTSVSSNAYLTVITFDLPTALNTTNLNWTTTGSALWFAETNNSHDGFMAAQSGLVANGQSSTLQTILTGPGTLTFWWMFSPLTSPFPNTLSFSSSDGNNSASVSSTSGWQQRTFYLGTGQQTLIWNYSRFSFISAQSTGWLDQVSFMPGGTPPTVTFMSPNAYVRANSSVDFVVSAYGTAPLAYQWQLNGTNLLNKTNNLLSLTDVQPTSAGVYSVMVTNGFGSIATNATLWVGQFALNTSRTNLFMSSNGFRLELDGILTTNSVVILGSTDLVNWLPLFTNSATTGSVQFLDVAATNKPARFYRAQE